MKVYAVISNWVCDCDNGSDTNIYTTREKALEDFNEQIRNARIDMNYDEEDEDSNIIEELDENNYSIYEDGYYSRNHINIRIEEKEVK